MDVQEHGSMDLSWLTSLPPPVQAFLIGGAGDFLGGVAADIAGRLIDAAGVRVRARFGPEPQRAAINRAVARALAATARGLTDDTDTMKHYLDMLGQWLAREAVIAEFCQIIDPRPGAEINLSLLREEFEALDFDAQYLEFELERMATDFVAAFGDAAAEEPALQGQIEIGLLRDMAEQAREHTRLLEEIAARLERNQELTPGVGEVYRSRRIDAAVPSTAEVGSSIAVVVQVRFDDSPLLGIEDWPSKLLPQAVEQESGTLGLWFPTDPQTGRPRSSAVEVEIVTGDFRIVGKSRKRLEVPPTEVSKVLPFSLVPLRAGNCSIDVDIYDLETNYIGRLGLATTVAKSETYREEASSRVATLNLYVLVIEHGGQATTYDLREATLIGGDQINSQGPVATHGSAINTAPGGAAVVGDNNLTITGDITHIVNILAGAGPQSEADYAIAVEGYLDWVIAAFGRVTLRGIKREGQQAIELPLEQVYVPLAAEALPDAREILKRNLRRTQEADEPASAQRISMSELLSQGRHLVAIGAPGCGKTTVLYHIAWTLARALRTGEEEAARALLGIDGPIPLPIYVPLSLYAEHRRLFANHADPKQCQLATFISHHLIERQAGEELPADFFAALLKKGQHVILLLDGLDEVPSEEERGSVSQAVKDLTYGREGVRLVVTCRTPAYQGPADLGDDFRVVRVLPLQPDDVAQLIRQAYQAIYPLEVEKGECERCADDLIESVVALEAGRATRQGRGEESRLVTSPLLVRMLLIVHFNLRRLPDQRAELYAEVVDTLLTSSHNPNPNVAQRLAQMGGDWRARRILYQYVASQMHGRGEDAGREISERDLTDLLCAYLVGEKRLPPEDAVQLAADFIAVNRQRSGLMEAQGDRHRFTHLSFQEFLMARHLAEVERDIERIARFVEAEGRAMDSWWREPFLLTMGYLNMTAPDAASDLMSRLAQLRAPDPPATAAASGTPVGLAGAELAATAFLEWSGTDGFGRELAYRLAALLEDRALCGAPGPLRAAAGNALSLLGDPRPGVGLRADGLPDIVWCDVPAGAFPMGNDKRHDSLAYDDERPRHQEPMPAGFSISKYLITNAQYAAFVQDGGYTERWRGCWSDAGWNWKEDTVGPRRYGGAFDLDNHPVLGVTWYEAWAFCRWLSEKLGLHVSLPTEAQWEKGARGVDGRRYPWGDEITPEHANYDETGVGETTAAGIFPRGASPYGALDMSGNVREWCLTKWRGEYKAKADNEVEGDAGRVVRGGSFDNIEWDVRCACRYGTFRTTGTTTSGFGLSSLPEIHDSGLCLLWALGL
jgi:formylglycine-generating enzyme required for sulfatase activity